MDTHRPSFLKSTIADWLEAHHDHVRLISLQFSGVFGSSLLFQAESKHIHMIIPSFVGTLDPPSSSCEEIFVVTSPDYPDSDQRFNSLLVALNEKLERLHPAGVHALDVAMEYLVAAIMKYQGESFQSSKSNRCECAHSGCNMDVADAYENDDDCASDDDGDHDLEEGGDDDEDYYNADEVNFGYDMALYEDAQRGATSLTQLRSKGYLYAMAMDAKQQFDRARQKFSIAPKPADVGDTGNSILAWCSLEPAPGDLMVHMKMQFGGIVSDDAAVACLGLSLDFPKCISLQISKEHWSREEYSCPLRVDGCVVKAIETKGSTAREEVRQSVWNLNKRHRFGEDILLPDLVDCYFGYLAGCDESIAKSANVLEDLTTHASNRNVFVGLMSFLAARLRALPNWCVSCWETLPYNVGRLRTCDKQLCLYRFEELGLGTTVLQEVQKHPELFDLEMSLAFAALYSDRDVFEPFPAFLLEGSEVRGRSGWFSEELEPEPQASLTNAQFSKLPVVHRNHLENKQMNLLKSILCAYPSATDMRSCTVEVELKEKLTTLWQNAPEHQEATNLQIVSKAKLWLPYDVLRFLLLTSRLTMQCLEGSEALGAFKTTVYQFAVLHDSPEKEAKFEKRREEMGGSFFAFHGSPSGNWYSILRNGLRSLSSTKYMSSGAAGGAGIYTASGMSVSCAYSRAAAGWHHGKLKEGFSILAICEIVRGSVLSNSTSGIMVVPPQHVQDILIRYILVFPKHVDYFAGEDRPWISLTTLITCSHSLDLLHHHHSLREAYCKKKQSEWKEAMKVRWASMQAMFDREMNEEPVEEEVIQVAQASLHEMSYRTSSSMPGSMQAIQKELKSIMTQIKDAKAKGSRRASDGSMLAGIEIDLPDESDLRKWHVHLSQHVFEGCPLFQDLADHAKHNRQEFACVKLECLFPDTFPMVPPFIRVMSPRFKFHTGHVTVGGSICMELLTESGWSPAVCFESVLVQIITAMMEGGARLEWSCNSEYSEHEARAAFDRVAQGHGWIKGK